MSIAVRSTKTTWEGPLASGTGTFSDSSSGVLDGQTVTWAARTEAPGGKTSPEELAAAAHSSCYAMALSLTLGENKTPADRVSDEAAVTLDEVDGVPTVTTSALTVRADVPYLAEAGFAMLADAPS